MVEKEVLDCMNDILDIVVKKEEKRLYDKNRYENNKEKAKQYYQDNKEKIIQQKKQYRKDNQEKMKEYDKSPVRKKQNAIARWKKQGLICDNYEQLYYHYLKTSYCDFCKVELTTDRYNTSTTKCMDHCHQTGLFRNILCLSCNVKRK